MAIKRIIETEEMGFREEIDEFVKAHNVISIEPGDNFIPETGELIRYVDITYKDE